MTSTLDRRSLLTGLGAAAVGGAAVNALAAPAAAEPSGKGRGDALIGKAARDELHVMSFNIRQDRSVDTDPLTRPGEADHWPDRRPILIDLLEREQPTLLGVQEAKFAQLPAIEEALPHHAMIGYGREGGSKDEYAAIFYDARRLEVISWDQRWLSDTPREIASTGWGNEITRIMVIARLRDLESGAEFAMINTHFDHQSEPARVKSAEALRELLEGDELEGLPTIITGDFNARAHSSEPHAILTDDGTTLDTWNSTGEKLTKSWGTFPNYKDPVDRAGRIDWVLTTPDISTTVAAINVSRSRDGAFPSDHTPVQALVTLP
ncbi:endonuclease/exonuclease/phosphatase family protein [Brachybacterium sp. YJGR34]|uniref:endonuclease/exonuclease/phosphatase family protein n=1 Tax=Brachybacterium sp. YJGR34 TaxID=2059911 RepID=UPI000E0ABF40|nr:endonuclease/exonuclease/phosphatase family protein [Brachybacterium sp. YJGR34]